MDTDAFADLLLGNGDKYVEKYIKNEKTQQEISVSACIKTICHILLENNLTTTENFNKLREMYTKQTEEELCRMLKKELKKQEHFLFPL